MAHEFSLVVCARWETQYILEFIRYYEIIGFDHVFLYCNDDDPAALHTKLRPYTQRRNPFVTFRHHPTQGQQREMYCGFLEEFGHSSNWFGFFDVDEFLRLPSNTTISSFMARWGEDVGAVLFNWIFFGTNGHRSPPAAPVLEAFTRRQSHLHPNTKFLIRSTALLGLREAVDHGAQPFWHRPNALMSGAYRIVNAIGEDASGYYEGFPDSCRVVIDEPQRRENLLATAVIHHYAFRSEQAFAERAARGTMGAFAGQQMWKKLAEGDGFAGFLASVNEIEDLTLAKFWHDHEINGENGGQRRATSVDRLDQHLARLSDKAVFSLFQSIGDDCEFALMQRHSGVEKLHLLQWASASPMQIVEMLSKNFEGLADEGKMTFEARSENADEMIMHDRVYGLYGHTWIKASSVNLEKVLADYQRHFRYMRTKIIDDLTGSNYIFVYRHMQRLDPTTIENLADQMSRYGSNILLIVSKTEGPQRAVGHVEWVGNCVLQGYMNEGSTPIWLFDDRGEAWSRICRRAVEAVARRYPKSPFLEPVNSALAEPREVETPPNVALGKPATQSSLSRWSIGNTLESDAAGAVGGGITGRARFHTDYEETPWWQVDLQELYNVTEIRIFNRNDIAELRNRASRLAIDVATVEGNFTTVFRRETDEPFGGFDGDGGAATEMTGPLIFAPPSPVPCRYVRIRLLTPNFLHLDQVEVYGAAIQKAQELRILPNMEEAYSSVKKLNDRDLFCRFTSLGLNCEFGIVQKRCGITKLGLLDWCATHPESLLKMLENRFEGIGESAQTKVEIKGDDYDVFDLRYDFAGHTFVNPKDVPQEKFFKQITARLKYLARKMIDDLESGDTIFLYKMNGNPVREDLIERISHEISKYGACRFLSVSDASVTKEVNGLVRPKGGILFEGHLSNMVDLANARDVSLSSWRELCQNALSVMTAIDGPGNQTERQEAARVTHEKQWFPDLINIALGKIATQSSTSQWSRGAGLALDAGGVVTGQPNGMANCHTEIEDSPWWMVDLGCDVGITSLVIYNRLDGREIMQRSARLAIDVGMSDHPLIEIYRRETDEPFGGIDGNPLVFKPAIPIPGRYVRIRLLTRNYLHLDQVEVYGEPFPFPP